MKHLSFSEAGKLEQKVSHGNFDKSVHPENQTGNVSSSKSGKDDVLILF